MITFGYIAMLYEQVIFSLIQGKPLFIATTVTRIFELTCKEKHAKEFNGGNHFGHPTALWISCYYEWLHHWN
jgi:hypothetical protein